MGSELDAIALHRNRMDTMTQFGGAQVEQPSCKEPG
jgi:hypothetical protein